MTIRTISIIPLILVVRPKFVEKALLEAVSVSEWEYHIGRVYKEI